MSKLEDKKKMLDALERNMGIVTSAVKACGLSRSTHYRWIAEDEEYAAAVLEINNIALDFAEQSLHSKIAEGDTPAIIFFLKTQGESRGYSALGKRQVQINVTQEKQEELHWSQKALDDDN